jgi:hypothetical protein
MIQGVRKRRNPKSRISAAFSRPRFECGVTPFSKLRWLEIQRMLDPSSSPSASRIVANFLLRTLVRVSNSAFIFARRSMACEHEWADDTLLWIRQGEGVLMALVVPDVCLGQNGLHEITGGEQSLTRYAPCISQISNPLLLDRIGPARCDQPFHGELDQQISEMKWVEDASVIHDDGRIRGHDLS